MFESSTEIIVSGIVLLASGLACAFVARFLRLPAIVALPFYLWHTLFSCYYANYILVNGGDAFIYYQKARFEVATLGLGTEFIVWLTSFPVGIGLTYWPVTLIYNLVGTLGVLLFYAALRESPAALVESGFGKVLMLMCVFIPSFSFWTGGIGKDSVACLSVGLFLWSTISFARRQPAAIAGIVIMLLIRPHIAALMVLATAFGAMFAVNLRASVRVSVVATAATATIFAVPLALTYAGTDRFGSVMEYVSDRQEQNVSGGSSIDLIGMSPPARVVSFLYRPMPNEAANIEQLAASLDNLLLIALSLATLMWTYRAGFGRVFRQQSMAFTYGLMSWVLLSQVTANLGLATRQKWMLVPALMLVALSAWGLARKNVRVPKRRAGAVFEVADQIRL
jgi:hypothetical protein